MHNKRKLILSILLGIATTLSTPSFASCIFQAQALPFGTYNPVYKPDTDISTQIAVVCNEPISLSIKMGKGNSSQYSQRYLMRPNSNEKLLYNVFTNANRSAIWGDGSSGTSFVSKNYSGSTATLLPVYGRIYGNQPVSPGTYSDSYQLDIVF